MEVALRHSGGSTLGSLPESSLFSTCINGGYVSSLCPVLLIEFAAYFIQLSE
jgi:hypothetical protein